MFGISESLFFAKISAFFRPKKPKNSLKSQFFLLKISKKTQIDILFLKRKKNTIMWEFWKNSDDKREKKQKKRSKNEMTNGKLGTEMIEKVTKKFQKKIEIFRPIFGHFQA